MTETSFPFVEIPDHLRAFIGEPDEGTRVYHQFGSDDFYEPWWYAVGEICGEAGCVSPGGVSMVAAVSRAGVHKRLKEGRLSAFTFHVTKRRRGPLGGEREVVQDSGRPYIYIPGSECEAWAELLTGKSKEERIREAIGDNDWGGDFMNVPTRKLKKRRQKKK